MNFATRTWSAVPLDSTHATYGVPPMLVMLGANASMLGLTYNDEATG
jgi:hypothetical protein